MYRLAWQCGPVTVHLPHWMQHLEFLVFFLLLTLKKGYFMCMGILPKCLFCAPQWYSFHGSQTGWDGGGVRSPGAGVKDGDELPCGC